MQTPQSRMVDSNPGPSCCDGFCFIFYFFLTIIKLGNRESCNLKKKTKNNNIILTSVWLIDAQLNRCTSFISSLFFFSQTFYAFVEFSCLILTKPTHPHSPPTETESFSLLYLCVVG